ncbi:hypothetical protein SAMN02982917_0562 [Azospirillum oryzae]|uniref:Uncharacterized protein n=1 Tax=Azospirillum oryzae TaxID=286727 RepID=A0A1X7HU16_9PROT|nr:hypothetical protein [Azospirillum oryzae]SMF92326.1 hypothetical protein SAMN02982917_0562 [Azospirillum oryzae]
MSNLDYDPHTHDMSIIMLRVSILDDLVRAKLKELGMTDYPPSPATTDYEREKEAMRLRIEALQPGERLAYHIGTIMWDLPRCPNLRARCAAVREAVEAGIASKQPQQKCSAGYRYLVIRNGLVS